jgi:competence protein ComEC
MDPQMTIISAAYESQYDHPRDEPLEAFADQEIAAYWTGIHGTIVFESDGQTWTVSTQADATTDPLEIRDEPEVEAEPTDDVEEHDTVATLGVRGHAPPPIVLRPPTAIPLGGLI